jgi:hypothetical protein
MSWVAQSRVKSTGRAGTLGARKYVSASVKERGSAMPTNASHEEEGPPG